MELTGLQTQLQAAANQAAAGETIGRQAENTATAVSKPVLSGASVKIRTPTDFRKLLAELNAENDENRVESCKSQLTAALAVLTARHESVSSAAEAVSAASDALTVASSNTAAAQAAYDESVAVLSDENDKLKKLVAADDGSEESKAAIAEQEQKVADQEQVVNDNALALDAARSEEAAAESALADAVANLDAVLARDVLVAAEVTARRLLAAVREQPGSEKLEEKAGETVEKLEAYVSRLDEMKDEEMCENVAKIVPDLVFLVTANYQVAPGDLPQYERRV